MAIRTFCDAIARRRRLTHARRTSPDWGMLRSCLCRHRRGLAFAGGCDERYPAYARSLVRRIQRARFGRHHGSLRQIKQTQDQSIFSKLRQAKAVPPAVPMASAHKMNRIQRSSEAASSIERVGMAITKLCKPCCGRKSSVFLFGHPGRAAEGIPAARTPEPGWVIGRIAGRGTSRDIRAASGRAGVGKDDGAPLTVGLERHVGARVSARLQRRALQHPSDAQALVMALSLSEVPAETRTLFSALRSAMDSTSPGLINSARADSRRSWEMIPPPRRWERINKPRVPVMARPRFMTFWRADSTTRLCSATCQAINAMHETDKSA